MSKRNLDGLIERLSVKLENEEAYRSVVDRRTHVYTVDRKKLWRELYDQISGIYVQDPNSIKLFFNNKNAPGLATELGKLLDKYIDGLRQRIAGYKSKNIEISKPTNLPNGGFKVELTGVGSSNTSIFDALNRIRKESTKQQEYLLPSLRKEVFDTMMNSSFIKNLMQSGNKHIESTLKARTIGIEYIEPSTGKKRVKGGLLEAGHGSGYSAIEQDIRDNIILGQDGLSDSISKLPKEVQELGKLRLIVKKNSVTSKHLAYIFEQGAQSNNLRSGQERKLREVLSSEIQAFVSSMSADFWANFESSSSVNTGIKHQIFSPAKKVSGSKTPNVKLQGVGSTPKSKPMSLKGKVDKTESTASMNIKSKGKGIRSTEVKQETKNWSSLLPIINRRLPIIVMKNMHPPALQNRTGRFANSTKVVGVETTKNGYPSLIFDYQRDPYDVFDKSRGRSPWNTPGRDPSTLVDKSIREIMRDIAVDRFYTRRA